MKEFKFSCPTCGQRILAPADSSGRKINCPSCQGSITIPSGPTEAKKPVLKPPTVRPPDAANQLKVSGRSGQGELPKKTVPAAPAPKPAPPAPPKAPAVAPPKGGGAVAIPKIDPEAPGKPEQLRVSVLTPAIKLDMVRSARKRISEESNWLPSKIEGDLAYAAKVSDGKSVVVDVKNPEATRFSLIGAFLRELHQRKVTGTAMGRTDLLDQEIPDAIRDILLDGLSEAEREKAGDPMADKNRKLLSHAQCLAALDLMEKLYSEQKEHLQSDKSKRKMGTVRLADLVPKLEDKARIAVEDVATALYHELMEVRKRLDRLEGKNKAAK